MRSVDRSDEERGLFAVLVGDGLPLLMVAAGSLVLGGGFAVFLALTGEFLPHDIRYLQMSAVDLCSVEDCRVVNFMIHDRAAFGGALIAVGVLYTYLVCFPLRRGEAWAWWLLTVSATAGFFSFLAYLGYGYLDTWHGIGTALLLPMFAAGLIRSRRLIGDTSMARALLTGRLPSLTNREGLGRAWLLAGAAGVAVAGLEILRIGVTKIFVPEDLAFIGVPAAELRALNPRLVPLIAHDRAGFGGAVFTTGLTALGCLWYSRTTRALWESMFVAGTVSLTAAIGIHLVVGYTDVWHLAPAMLGAASLLIGQALTFSTAYRLRGTATANPSVLPHGAGQESVDTTP
ncbi:MAG TPA: hypothetical protein VHN18_18820 [Micromonosporaceae bacterium]|nr:hypothetical protein [Micromonosporaceae bacterium]